MTERVFCKRDMGNAPASTPEEKETEYSGAYSCVKAVRVINRSGTVVLPPPLLYAAEVFVLVRYFNTVILEVICLFDRIREDIAAVKERDPAAKNSLEIFLLYPGVKALRMYRRAHFFYNHNMFFIARSISQRAARKTGIEIHPGAKIGRRLVIDHGHGVVIGETAEIGDDVLIYQGVTLGGTGKDTGKRHPTIGNNVMISTGAKVLGPFKVGDNSRIAAGAVVLEEVPPDCTVVGVPARIVKRAGAKVKPLDQIHIPDPVAQEICRLEIKIKELENKLKKEEAKNENI